MTRVGPAAEVVLGGWMVAGTLLGTAIGATTQLVRVTEGVGGLALAGAAIGLGLGGLAWRVDRRLAAQRPALLDGQGRPFTPLAAWVWAVPALVVFVGLAALVVVGSVRADALWPGALFALIAAGLAWGLRPMWARRLIGRALQRAEGGDVPGARQALTGLSRAAWAPRQARELAYLSLGTLALQEQDLAAAERAWVRCVRGSVGTHAAVRLALVCVLSGRLDQASANLRRARSGPGLRGVQDELDAVRALLTLRREGPEEARALAEPLVDERSGSLLVAVLAIALDALGEEERAELLLDMRVRRGLSRTGLDGLVPELADLLR